MLCSHHDIKTIVCTLKLREFVKKLHYFRFSGLYALVNNAGVCVCGEFEWQTWNHIEQQIKVNLLGTMRVTRHCIPLLKAVQGKKTFDGLKEMYLVQCRFIRI